MQNLHTHKHYSNCFAPFKDSHVFYQDYAKRAKELGQQVITSVEHGFQGNYLRCWEVAQEAGLKYVYGVEAYWVADRTLPDNTNAHILILARNKKGIFEINKMLSTASKDGFYGKPRIDPVLMRTLTPENVFVTTACVSFWGKVSKTSSFEYHDDIDDLFMQIYRHFGESLYLEVQTHNTSWQKIVNQHCLDLHYQYGVPLICGLDSHYIYPEQKKERQLLRDESGVKMTDDDHELQDEVYEDYPDEETVIARFRRQGVLNEEEIAEAIRNTDISLTFEDIVFDRTRKMPKTYQGMMQEQCAQEYERRIREAFDVYASNLPEDEKERRWNDMWVQEVAPVIEEQQSVYFLLNSDLIKLGQSKGGTYTNSGRGSAGSFFSNKLLGLTGLDRFDLPVTLYPSRFMTRERLKTSVADIDMNVSAPEPFVQAQEELMGKGHVAPMIAYGTQKAKSAFRMYARAVDLPMDIQSKVSAQIEEYERAYNNADDEDEKENIFIEDFVDEKFLPYIDASEAYRGIVVSKSQAPCGYLLYDGDIESEIGLVYVKSKNSKKGSLCTVIDGYTADAYGYIKNDVLTVIVAAVNAITSKKAGIPYLSAEELIKRTENDPATWDVFAKGYTLGINQCQGAKTIEKLMRYKPRSLQDMSAFVAAIRPGFKSMVQKFLGREKFDYGIPSFDGLLHNDSTGSSWLLYQEDVMKVLGLAGFPMEETYPIIKAISKKKVKVIDAAKARFIEGFIAYQREQDENISDDLARKNSETVWQILYDSSSYSFNACVTGDTKLFWTSNGRWSPTVGEMFRTRHDPAWAKENGHRSLHGKYKRQGYPSTHSMFEDGRTRQNRIVDIREVGVRQVWRTTTVDGRTIETTINHKFPTPSGEKPLSNLQVGDELYVQGEYEKTVFDSTFTGVWSANFPTCGQRGFQRDPNGGSVLFHTKRDECVTIQLPCEECGRPYNEDENFELHHIDSNRHNNNHSNLRWLCNSCHKTAHYKLGRTRRGQKGYPVQTAKILSIEPVGYKTVYDVEMAAPAHNFVVSTGIITCNSHSVAVALDALYGAYLKAHYPHEYYSTLLDVYTAKGDKDKVSAIKAEMLKAFGIKLVPCRFRQDNRQFSYDKVANTMSDALPSIKNLSLPLAEELYSMRNGAYFSFVDVLHDMEYRRPFRSDNIDVLIKMGYFSEFGKSGKLLDVCVAFREGKGIFFSKGHSLATQKKRLAALNEFEAACEDRDLPMYEQLSFESIFYGSPISIFPTARKMYVVLDVDTKYSPKITMYSAVTGKTGMVKVLKKTFDAAPLSPGDVIVYGNYREKPKYAYRDGERVKIAGQKEFWMEDYTVVYSPPKKEKPADKKSAG